MRIATRSSQLALWQANHVSDLVVDRAARSGVELVTELVVVETSGDRRQEVPIWEMGGKGVFVKEVQAAVLDGRADIAVHSAKDLPSVAIDGLMLAAVPARADARDALVGCRLDDLPTAGVVATGSVRRRAQLAWLRPDLTFVGLRGNMTTRLARVGEVDAVIVALAAMERLGLVGRVAQVLEPSEMLPQVGQGALAVECRVDDGSTAGLLKMIEHTPTRLAVEAERAMLATLGGGCDLPAGAHGELGPDAVIVLEGMLASMDGHVILRHTLRGEDPVRLGTQMARYLLDDAGGSVLLER